MENALGGIQSIDLTLVLQMKATVNWVKRIFQNIITRK
jgi:hypothetical protein